MNRPCSAGGDDRMPRQIRHEMRGHADRSHARTAAAVRDAECLVQIDVTDVGADRRRAGEADLRVHVRAVHVDLPAELMDDRAHVLDRFLEHTVRRRIGHHQRRQPSLVRFGLLAEIGDVDVPVRRARHDDDAHAGHDGAGMIGAVRRRRNQTDVALRLAAILEVSVNHHQAGELALRARVRLQRDGGKAGDRAQHRLELAEDLGVALRLIDRRERMQRAKLRPGDRQHLGRRVQLHRARAERNHRRVEPDVLSLEAADVAHHLGLGVILVEDRMRQERRRAADRGRIARVDVGSGEIDCRRRARVHARGERRHDGADVVGVDRLVERDGDRPIATEPEIDLRRERGLQNPPGHLHVAAGDREARGVEVLLVDLPGAELRQLAHEKVGERVDARRDSRQTFRAVIDGVEAGDVGEERLRRADVRGRLLATDMLLARLQRHAVRGVAVRVDRNADDAAGRLADVLLERREERGVRTAIAERHAEPLRVAIDHVGAELAGRRQQDAAQEIGPDRDRHAGAPRVGDERAQIVDAAVGIRRLHQRAEHAIAERRLVEQQVGDHRDLDAERLGARPQDVQRLREHRIADQELRRRNTLLDSARLDAMQHRHRFTGGGRLVEQRCVGHFHRRQIAHHRLEVEERFEAALRDLGLVRGVGRVPAGILEHVAQDDARRDAAGVAETDERAEHLIAGGGRAQVAEEALLALAVGQIERRLQADARRNRLVDQRVERGRADDLEHLVAFGFVGTDVAGLEGFEGERGHFTRS